MRAPASLGKHSAIGLERVRVFTSKKNIIMEENINRSVADEIVAQAVEQPTAEEQAAEVRRQELAALRIMSTTEVRPEESTLTVDGVGIFARDDIHAIKGKQKCGKTSALKVCIAAWMNGQQFRVVSPLEAPRVLFLDTEQKQADVKLIVTDVLDMTGLDAEYVDSHLAVYALRRRNFELLLDDMRLLILDFQPDVVIIDGIVEFVASFNDESMAKQLIHELLIISEDRHCAIVNVLHTNKADDDHNMRGHLGTMLAQKAGTVLECKKLGGVITVACSEARHQEMPDWSIRFSDDGHLQDADEQRLQQLEQRRQELALRRQEAAQKKVQERLDYALLCIRDNGGSMSRKQLTEILVKKFEIDRSTASKFIASQIEAKTLYEADKNITASPETALAF